MKKLQSSLAAKLIAAFLLFVTACIALVSLAGCLFLVFENAYFDGGIEFIDNAEASLVREDLWELQAYTNAVLEGNRTETDHYENKFSRENSNLIFTVSDENGDVIVSNGTAGEDGYRYRYIDSIEYIAEYGELRYIAELFSTHQEAYWYIEDYREKNDFDIYDYTVTEQGDSVLLEMTGRDVTYRTLNIEMYIMSGLAAHDIYHFVLGMCDGFVYARYLLIVLAISAAVLGTAFFVFLLWSAGHRRGYEGIHLSFVGRIPLDIIICIIGALIASSLAFIDSVYTSDFVYLVFCGAVGAFWLALLLAFIYTLTARIKARVVFSNTVIWRLIRLLITICKKTARFFMILLRTLPLYWKAGIALVVLTAIEVFFIAGGMEWFLFIWTIELIITLPIIAYFASMLSKLQRGGKELASGNLTYNISTKGMLPALAEHGENLNNIRFGMKRAVEEMTRSERMKAELITNVSHDIKTPLTSIVNYVDLLEKEGLDGEHAKEYLSVLSRQSARLKKLTEDLIEASKASTGNIAVNLEITSVNVLLSQALGEYEEKFSRRELETRLDPSEENPTVMADGRLLWRVIDNLLCNIFKYALEGTRVYITTECDAERVNVVFRNISKEILSVSGKELTERFVRGDTSRNTEGSGLGLSIAEDLIRLQGGKLSVITDGDLFKVTVIFERAQNEKDELSESESGLF